MAARPPAIARMVSAEREARASAEQETYWELQRAKSRLLLQSSNVQPTVLRPCVLPISQCAALRGEQRRHLKRWTAL